MLRYTMIIGVVVALSTGSILAQAKAADAKKPATTKAVAKTTAKAPAKASTPKTAADKLQITVLSVSGIVEQRSATEEKAKWTAVKAGDVLKEMTLIRTGLGAKVVLKLADRGNVTVKNGSKMGIGSFRKQGKLVKTRLGLKYGAIRAQVDSSRGANDFRVRTPVGTLAATGTGGDIAMWGDFLFQAKGTDGSWQTAVSNRVIAMIAGEWTDAELKQPLAILLEKYGIKLGDAYGGMTPAELKNLLLNGGGRGIIGFVGNGGGQDSPQLIRFLQSANGGNNTNHQSHHDTNE